MYLYKSTYFYARKVPKDRQGENFNHLSRSHRIPGLSSKFAWLMVQKFLIMVQWAACIIVQPAHWFNFWPA